MDKQETDKQLLRDLKAVLKQNDRGEYTVPAQGIYPHQWLWDSCFIAIGLRHFEPVRAQKEILSLFRGQWANGMMPNMILSSTHRDTRDGNIWRSWVNPAAPDNVATSGITQPPMLAEAVIKVGEKLTVTERRSWYQSVYPSLLSYHQWLYSDRDPHGEGLLLQIHPWESGMDNSPIWMSELKQHLLPFWIRLVQKLHFTPLINLFRRDTHFNIPAEERLDTIEALALYHMQRRLRRKMYDTEKALPHALLTIEDLGFNCIFIRANSCLKEIAKFIGKELPKELREHIHKTEEALEQLWDPYTGMYYARNFVTHKLIKEPTISTLLPLYGGSVTKERAEELVKLLQNIEVFWTDFPIPSVPLNSSWFKPHGYWQGPVWVNTNWLIIQGLKRYGYDELAKNLADITVQAVAKNGPSEYFSPLDGSAAGARDFSWTAALTIDLAKSK